MIIGQINFIMIGYINKNLEAPNKWGPEPPHPWHALPPGLGPVFPRAWHAAQTLVVYLYMAYD